MEEKIPMENRDADWDDIIDPAEPPELDVEVKCVLCGCTPAPDQWSKQVENACFDCP